MGDVGDPELLARTMEGVCGLLPSRCHRLSERGVREWRETHRVNLSAFVALLDAARAAGGVPVVYASSAAVYGSNDALPLAETADTRPLSAYGADKLGCELQARVAGAVTAYRHSVALFQCLWRAAGPGLALFRGNFHLRRPAAARRAADRVRDGLQSRDFVHVQRLWRRFVPAWAGGYGGAVFNVCAGRSTTVLGLGTDSG